MQQTAPLMRRISRIHFVGIGGAGMSGIAQVLLHQGYEISGSDLHQSGVTQTLSEQGARIYYEHLPEQIEGADVVVQSTAINDANPEISAARAKRIPVVPRAQMLAELMRFRHGIAVAGTHGKTTTTSLLSSILQQGDLDPTYIIGGKLNSAGCHANLGTGQYLVAEADESDASFLHLQPMMVIITNIDADHMGTYNDDFALLKDTFLQFCHHLPFYGLAVVCLDDPVVASLLPKISRPLLTYGFDSSADCMIESFEQKGMKSYLRVRRVGKHPPLEFTLNMPGQHNALNAVAAVAIATELGVSDDAITTALGSFEGVGRRLQSYGQIKTTRGKIEFFDDYGHHPREIEVTLEALKAANPQRRIVVVFEPHRFSRTQALFDDFSRILSKTDQLLLLPVYPAGEAPISGADSRSLCRNIRSRGLVDPIFVSDPLSLPTALLGVIESGDIVLMQGAGSIGKMMKPLIDNLKI